MPHVCMCVPHLKLIEGGVVCRTHLRLHRDQCLEDHMSNRSPRGLHHMGMGDAVSEGWHTTRLIYAEQCSAEQSTGLMKIWVE